MLVNPFTSIVNANASNSQKTNDKIQTAISQIASGDRVTRAADDVSSLSVATDLQNRISSFRSALSNTSLATSQLQVANNDIVQIQEAIGQLQEIGAQANNGALNDANREALNNQAQEIAAEIDRIAANSTFNDQKLLDGSLSGGAALSLNGILGQSEGEDITLSLESLDTEALFGVALDFSSPASATEALATLQQAANSVATQAASVGAFASQIDFASATIETAIANQEAARSTISDADFTEAATELTEVIIQNEAGISVKAQAQKLAPSMLKLIS